MRLNRFYTERTNLTLNSSVKLPDSDIRHIRNVLRLKKGDEIILFNGEKEFLAELSIVGREFITAIIKRILKIEDFSEESGVEISIFQSLLRSGKFDFIVEKSTELGISNIYPVENEFSQMKIEVAERKLDRWNKLVIAASKQSERVKIPEIHQPLKFIDIVEMKDKFDLMLFFTVSRSNIKESLKTIDIKDFFADYKGPIKKIGFLIGPEGGFSPGEHKLALEAGFKFVSFGDTILRSETAAIAAFSILKYIVS